MCSRRIYRDKIADICGAFVLKTYICAVCGVVYSEAEGLPGEGIPAGTRWEDVPADWKCPECGAGKQDFEMMEV